MNLIPKNNQPTHIIYHLIENSSEDGKPKWLRIGAAWSNKDGKGLNCHFDSFPTGKPNIIIREPKPREQ